MKEYYIPEYMSYRHPRKLQAPVFDYVLCPSCGHFAAYRLDKDGKVDVGFDKAISYRCAILTCNKIFSPEEAIPTEKPHFESECTGAPLIMDRKGLRTAAS